MAGLRNELEAYIYGSRDKMERDDIVKVSTEQQREGVSKLCTEYEDWIHEAGHHPKSEFETKLKALQDLLSPMEERALRDGIESRSPRHSDRGDGDDQRDEETCSEEHDMGELQQDRCCCGETHRI